jgi:molybdate transport system substrate-binding protein
MVRNFMFAAASAALLTLAPIADAKAAELKVLAGGSMTDSLREIGPQFERATGYKLVFLFAGTPELIRQATSGAPFDIGVVPVD